MRYAKIKTNDTANIQGISVSVYLQGCPYHCRGCFNPETWDFMGGQEFTIETLHTIIAALTDNNIHRDLCILGGEPLCQDNLFLTYMIVDTVLKEVPNTKIYIWTGNTIENLQKDDNPKMKEILNKIHCLIDGPYIDELRDITLHMRGSSNQRVLYRGVDF